MITAGIILNQSEIVAVAYQGTMQHVERVFASMDHNRDGLVTVEAGIQLRQKKLKLALFDKHESKEII
jgi:hypothetical protein